jgi:hypothetical protein
MALPKLASSKYELTLPSTGQKVEYRPFLVKEKKTLMIAQQTGKESDMIRAVQNIVSACTFEAVNSKTMPLFDLEYVFLQLRSKSVGEIAQLKVKCPDDGTTEVEVNVPLDKIECVKEEGHDTNIKLTDTIGIVMDYPTVDMMVGLDLSDETKSTFEIIRGCVSQIYDAENVYVRNDMEQKDLDEFIDSMSHEQFEKLSNFFDTMPKVKYTVKVTNPNTGVESDVVLQGLSDFF